MSSAASITVLGYLGKDPEYDPKSEAARFSIATSRKRQKGDLTTWWSVTAWRNSAKFVSQYLRKGDLVMVTGDAYLDTFKDRDGKDRQVLKIDARDVQSCERKAATATTTASEPRSPRIPAPTVGDDEPPF